MQLDATLMDGMDDMATDDCELRDARDDALASERAVVGRLATIAFATDAKPRQV